MPPQSITLPFQDDGFWANVNFDGPIPERYPELGPCWVWTAALRNGYGRVFRGKRLTTHRYAYEKAHSIILPPDILVCHHCDNKLCVNPSHFFLGTNLDNIADRHAKGRDAKGERHAWHLHPELVPRGDRHMSRTHPEALKRGNENGSRTHPESRPRGERNTNAKLTEDQVREIRRSYAAGGITQTALAARFDVSQMVISCIVLNKTWKHVLP